MYGLLGGGGRKVAPLRDNDRSLCGTRIQNAWRTLTASEVAQLKLNADWVILSVCNTAAPDGTPGAEGLSGLAKSFFLCGEPSVTRQPLARQIQCHGGVDDGHV